jgi:transcriptional regulator with XRE-family HTH domain
VENYFSKNLKYLRKKENLDLEQMGRILGKGKSVVNGYENGKNEPPLSVCYKLVRYFGIDLVHLVEKDLEKAGLSGYEYKEHEMLMASEPNAKYIIPALKLTKEDYDKLMLLAKELPNLIPTKK